MAKKLSRYKASFWDLTHEGDEPVSDKRPVREIAKPEDLWICWVCGQPCVSIRLQDDEPSHPDCLRELAKEKGKTEGRYRGNDPRVFAYLRETETLSEKGDSGV